MSLSQHPLAASSSRICGTPIHLARKQVGARYGNGLVLIYLEASRNEREEKNKCSQEREKRGVERGRHEGGRKETVDTEGKGRNSGVAVCRARSQDRPDGRIENIIT